MLERLLPIMLFLAAPCLAAQDEIPATDTDDVVRLDKVSVVSSKVERPLREVAGVVTVIDDEAIENWLVQDIADLVRYEPGVSMDREPSRFGTSGYTIRGVSGNRVLVELDGVPIQDQFAIGDFSNAGRNLVDPELLGRVEILRGPASALYGSDAIGGVVVYRTLDPRDYLSSNQGSAYRTRLAYDGRDEGVGLTALTAQRGKAIDTLALVNTRRGHEFSAAGAEPNSADTRSHSGLVKFVRYDNAGRPLRITLDARRGERQTEVDSLEGAPGRFATTTRLSGDDENRRYRFSLEQEGDGTGDWLDGYVWRVYHQDTRFEQRTVQELDPGGMTPYPSRRERWFNYDQRTSGGEFTGEHAFATASFEHVVVYGLEISRSVVTERRDGVLTNLESGDTSNVIIGEQFPLRDFPVSRIIESGIYVQDEISMPGGNWTVIPALRFEHYDLEPRTDDLYQAGIEPVDMTEQELTPRLAAVRRLGQDASLFLQYSRGFRSPPFDDVNIGLELPLFNVRAIPNPDLVPERSDSLEFGYRYGTADAGAEFSLFYSEYENLIESRVPLGFDPVSGLLLFQSQNRDEARIHGAEFRSYLELETIATALQGWRVDLAAGITRGRDTARGEWLNSVDPDRLILGVAYRQPDNRWRVELITTAVARTERVDESNGELFQPAGHATIDLLGHVDIADSWRLNWGIFNLADRKNWQWSDVRGMGPQDPALALAAQPERHVRVSLRLEW